MWDMEIRWMKIKYHHVVRHYDICKTYNIRYLHELNKVIDITINAFSYVQQICKWVGVTHFRPSEDNEIIYKDTVHFIKTKCHAQACTLPGILSGEYAASYIHSLQNIPTKHYIPVKSRKYFDWGTPISMRPWLYCVLLLRLNNGRHSALLFIKL